MEALGHVHGVLAGHGVGHQQHLRGLELGLDALQLGHQGLVYVQASGRVQDQHVAALAGCRGQRMDAYFHRVAAGVALVHRHADLGAQRLELGDGRGPLYIGGHQKRLFAGLLEHAGQLARRGGLTCALQAHHHQHVGRAAAHVQGLGLATHQRGQLLLDDLDDHLGGGEAFHHLLAHGPLAHSGNEVLGDLVVDVGFQQGQADFSHGVGNVLFR